MFLFFRCNKVLKKKNSEDGETIYSAHSCKYFETDEFQNMTRNCINQLSIFSLNIQSLPNKFDELKNYLSELNHGKF